MWRHDRQQRQWLESCPAIRRLFPHRNCSNTTTGKERREGCREREAAGLGIASLPSSEQRDLDRPPVGQDLPIQLQWSLRQTSRSCVEDLAWTCWLATRTWLPPSTTLLGCLFRGYLPSISKHLDVDRSHLEVGHILSGGVVSVGLISEECTLYHTNQTR